MSLTTITAHMLCAKLGILARSTVGMDVGEAINLGDQGAAHHIDDSLLVFTPVNGSIRIRRIEIATALVVNAMEVDSDCIAGQEQETAAAIAQEVLAAMFP